MINSRNVVTALRRDVSLVGQAVVAVLFIAFVSLALAATIIDLMALRH